MNGELYFKMIKRTNEATDTDLKVIDELTRCKSSVIDFDFKGTYAGFLIRLRFNEQLNPFYIKWLFAQSRYRKYFSSVAKPAGGQANINVEELGNTIIDYYPIDEQKTIVSICNAQKATLDGLRLLRSQAESRVSRILSEVWVKMPIQKIKER